MPRHEYKKLQKIINHSGIPGSMRRDRSWIRKQILPIIEQENIEERDRKAIERESISTLRHIARSKRIKAHWTRSIKNQNSQGVNLKISVIDYFN